MAQNISGAWQQRTACIRIRLEFKLLSLEDFGSQ